jgi:hypothetical protein
VKVLEFDFSSFDDICWLSVGLNGLPSMNNIVRLIFWLEMLVLYPSDFLGSEDDEVSTNDE